MLRMKTVPIPKEHGAYVVLVASWLLGLLQAPGREALPVTLSLLLPLGAFLAQEPLRLLLRGGRASASRHVVAWLALFAGTAIVAGGWLLSLRPRLWLVMVAGCAVAALFAWLLRRRAAMLTLSSAGFLGLSLGAPLARIAAAPATSVSDLVVLWGVAVLFFASSSSCVRIRLKREERGTRPIVLHAALLALLLVLAEARMVPPVAAVAVLPAIARLAWILRDLPGYRRSSLKRIGIVETAVTALFLAINSVG